MLCLFAVRVKLLEGEGFFFLSEKLASMLLKLKWLAQADKFPALSASVSRA